ncbi:MAG: Rpp14/Pop5 family protein [Candidatus Micrarchaeota archaeon]
MKQKNRFLRFAVECGAKLGEQDARKLVEEALVQVIGSNGIAKHRVEFRKFDEAAQVFWLRCSSAGVDEVVAAIALKRFFEGKDIALRLQLVSGSLK